ncbi:hypothetical protein A2V56_04845 [Candidatus Woesebacteria bacterium RBG_19FT_COMBO_42_9]|uniref:Uncharacterized protein n=1 Tax=Candidatus Woesebacteria bacterium RBG_16_42_24 TaxID=1802485 RepID=A0A1F7XLL3_9BACT|nr:MAG: hypothetical protein A2V97_04080 [Candidatus Woesebacteria bacterium RBG_16_42_24]OGM17726.1 MAG: hypothetical protein A2V56_04845 [Candidatus Woesebacteria bacterium RBG_19FT_COMBO_42_9]OGM66532.1 MAG: hypothetical protein A2985_03005 [Candidatus Woesebacteria bacterium RIFCSPLOWO2_01_FULL_43_11]
MKRVKLDTIVEFFDSLVSEERLDLETRGQIAKAIKDLSHGLAIKDLKQVSKAVDRLSKSLLNNTFRS